MNSNSIPSLQFEKLSVNGENKSEKATSHDNLTDIWQQRLDELNSQRNTLKIPLYFSKYKPLSEKKIEKLRDIIMNQKYTRVIEIEGIDYELSNILIEFSPKDQNPEIKSLYENLLLSLQSQEIKLPNVDEFRKKLGCRNHEIKHEKNTIKIILYSNSPHALSQEDTKKIQKLVREKPFNLFIEIEGHKRLLLNFLCSNTHFQYPRLIEELIDWREYNVNEIEKRRPNGHPLLSAIAANRYQNAIKLIECGKCQDPNGINVNVKEPAYGNTALLLCLRQDSRKDPEGWRDLIDRLITLSDLKLADRDGNTALHVAAFLRNSELVEKLIKNGADPSRVNYRGEFPLDLWNLELKNLQDKHLKRMMDFFPCEKGKAEYTFDLSKRQSVSKVPDNLIVTSTGSDGNNARIFFTEIQSNEEEEVGDREPYLRSIQKLENYIRGYEKFLEGDLDEITKVQAAKIDKVTKNYLKLLIEGVQKKLNGASQQETQNISNDLEIFEHILNNFDNLTSDYLESFNEIKKEAILAQKRVSITKRNTLDIILSSSYQGFINPKGEDALRMKAIIRSGDFNEYVKDVGRTDGRREPLLKLLCVSFKYFSNNGIIEALHKKGFNINFQESPENFNPFPGNTVLIWTIANAHYQNAIKLLEFGIPCGLDVNLQDNNEGNNALLLCLKKGIRQDPDGWKKLVTMLIEHTSLDDGDAQGNTPLHVASLRREEEIVKLLIQKGADPDVTNYKGQRAKDLWALEIKSLNDKNLKEILGFHLKMADYEIISFDAKERNKRPKEPPKELTTVNYEGIEYQI